MANTRTKSQARVGDMSIVVVGAGLVGSACALALANIGYRVTVVDVRAPEIQRGNLGVDIRNVALNPQSRALLEPLSIWPSDATPYIGMHVWEEFGRSRLEFSAAEASVDALGWLVESSPLQVALWQACESRCTCIVDEVLDIEQLGTRVRLAASSQSLEADLVIAADGGRSRLAQMIDRSAELEPVDQTAIATVLRCERTHEHIARQRFLVDGPLALLPGPQPDLVSVVWSQSPATAERRMGLGDAAFREEIERASESVLGRVEEVDRRMAFPLSQQWRSPKWEGERILFIGDAQRVVHPLAGLGANLGFEDVAALVDVLRHGIGSERRMREYVTQRHARSVEVIRLLAALKRVYGASDPWITLARNLGVGAINRMAGIKRQIMREAMGLGPLARI